MGRGGESTLARLAKGEDAVEYIYGKEGVSRLITRGLVSLPVVVSGH